MAVDLSKSFAPGALAKPSFAMTKSTPFSRVSRRNSVPRGASSLLVFDGKRFLQYLEGGEAAIRAMVATMRSKAA